MVSLSGSFQTSPNFWLNPKNLVTYQIAVQAPQYRMTDLNDLMNIPVISQQGPQLMGNLVQVAPSVRAATVNHYNVQPVMDVYASTQDRDLGAVAADTDKILKEFDQQLPLRNSSSHAWAGFHHVIFLLWTGCGSAGRDRSGLSADCGEFPVLAGSFYNHYGFAGSTGRIGRFLLLTHTRLSVPSLTGAVMCMGVATANSILMVSFAREQMDEGMPAFKAAVAAGYTRIRPVLMTALAMIIGMVPMALGFGEGGEQNAPLGRAVIGGLLFATVATLFFVPSVFAIFHGRRERKRARELEA